MKRNAALLILSLVVSSCLNLGDRSHIHTNVNSDGSLEREITIYTRDSVKFNRLGVSEGNGWIRQWSPDLRRDTTERADTSYVRFTKRFNSSGESNIDLNSPNDTLFKIRSELKKRNWFFYSELRYSDTYMATVRFKSVSASNYFTDVDFVFLDRNSKTKLSREDSIYGVGLSKRADDYLTDGFFGDIYQITVDILKEKSTEERWMDTLETRKDYLRNLLMEGDFNVRVYSSVLNDSLKIPVRFNGSDSSRLVMVEKRLANFFDSYTHSIRMPAKINSTNADSVSGSYAFWNPEDRFLYKDYTMYAGTRTIHWGTVAITLAVLIAALILWIKLRE